LALVLDASALLAYLHDEPGAELVTEAIADGVAISTVNLAEVLSHSAGRGADPAKIAAKLVQSAVLSRRCLPAPLGEITDCGCTRCSSVAGARPTPVESMAGIATAGPNAVAPGTARCARCRPSYQSSRLIARGRTPGLLGTLWLLTLLS
jgi:hypothetical protein